MRAQSESHQKHYVLWREFSSVLSPLMREEIEVGRQLIKVPLAGICGVLAICQALF